MSENRKATFAASVLMKRLIDRRAGNSNSSRQTSSTLAPTSTKNRITSKAATPSNMATIVS